MILFRTAPSRPGGWALFLLATCGGIAAGAEPSVRFVAAKKGLPVVVEAAGLSEHDLAALKTASLDRLRQVLAVRVKDGQAAMLGEYRVEKNTLRFESRFPSTPGITYVAELNLGKRVQATATVARPPVVATTELLRIYPTADTLAENHLRFYLHFSASMGRNNAYANLRLLDDKGKEVRTPFLELGEELWDPDVKRFTLFLHPGRVKRGLALREELGPILEEGKRYTLVVEAAWPDAEGNPLKAAVKKSFMVGKPDDVQPDPKNWEIRTPAAGGKDALVVHFPESLDHALALRMIWIEDGAGKRVDGEARLDRDEMRWQFIPTVAWNRGPYRLAADTALEDRSGNSIARPFEVDLVQPIPKPDQPKTAVRAFEVK